MTEGQGFARRVASENLQRFAPLLGGVGEGADAEGSAETETGQEVDPDAANEEAEPDPERAEAESLFGGTSISVSVPFRRPPRRPRRRGDRRGGRAQPGPEQGALGGPGQPQPRPTAARGPLRWRKPNLPASDAQRPPTSDSNPTGNLRLAQAGFQVDGERIDQTTYFRNVVFGDLDWQRTGDREDAWADFAVTILGREFGVHRLRVSHNPGREAEQHNVTTTLHWGGLGETLRTQINVRNRTLSLYGPPRGQDSPFFIEIT